MPASDVMQEVGNISKYELDTLDLHAFSKTANFDATGSDIIILEVDDVSKTPVHRQQGVCTTVTATLILPDLKCVFSMQRLFYPDPSR